MEPIKWTALADPRFKANPYPFYARMRAQSPVFPVSIPVLGRFWFVTRYEDVITVATDDRFSRDILPKVQWLPSFALVPLTRHMLSQDPPNHGRLRKLVSQAFTPRRVERMRDRIQAVCDELLDAVPRTGSFDLINGYALPIPLIVISELLGIPKHDRRRFHTLVRGSLPLAAPSGVFDIPIALPYVWLLNRYFRKLFVQCRARPGDDLLSALVQAEEAGDRLDEDELLGMAALLLLAGYETTLHVIGTGALALLEHPDQRARFVSEPGLAGTAIEELLRYSTPVEITTPRIVRDSVTLASVTIPKGEWAIGVLGSANRDESVFTDPDTLDLARDPNPHLAFGHGRHFCLGASLARMEAQVALTTLFRRFPGLHLAQPAASLRWRRQLLRGLVKLPLTGLT